MQPNPAPLDMPVTPAVKQPLPAWLREPLLHFVLLGALLFAIDHFLVVRDGDPRTIVIGTAVDKEARDAFKAARGREPDADELRALRQAWLDNEVLYREGLAMQLDRGDSAIRERVIFKALSAVDAATRLPPVDEKTLRSWFEAHRDKYDEPSRFDFQEATLSGEHSESAVRALVAAINGGTQGDIKAGLQVFKGRPRNNVVVSYGAEFARALAETPVGEWRAFSTREGWRAMRLEAIAPATPATFDAVQDSVRRDWADDQLAVQRTAAVRELVGKYKVKVAAEPR